MQLDQIYSIEFINSLCFIRKKPSEENKLGKSVVVGEDERVAPDRKKFNNSNLKVLNQTRNPWSNRESLPEEELELLKKKMFLKIKLNE